MAINKVVFGNDTLIDISGDSVVASALLSGYTAHGANGESINGIITIASASSYTPSAATQTIPSGIYLTGVQTIAGDVNLIAENIAEGISIFGITGTHHGGPDIWRLVVGEYLVYIDQASISNQTLTTPGTVVGAMLSL